MSHEVSETIDRPSGAYNVYGGTQYPLNPIFGFERSRYDSIPQAVNAAQWRSHMGGGPEGGQSPAYGFQPQAQPEYIGYLKQVLAALNDERLGALFAPGMGLIAKAAPILKAAGSVMARPSVPRPYTRPPIHHEPVEVFVDRKTGMLHSGEDLMRQGKDPWLGYDRTWGTRDQSLDYLPDGVRTEDQANRYLGAWSAKMAKQAQQIERMLPELGGFHPKEVPQHYSTSTQRLSSNPTSYADTLDTRWKAMDQMVQSGQAEGMARQQALDAVKQLNMLPPGFDETIAMRNYRPSQN